MDKEQEKTRQKEKKVEKRATGTLQSCKLWKRAGVNQKLCTKTIKNLWESVLYLANRAKSRETRADWRIFEITKP